MSAPLDIPVIKTERLIRRGPQERDFQAFATFAASERTAHVGGPHSRFRSWGAFLATFGHWAMRGFGIWMMEHRATGATAGRIGMIHQDGWSEPELGWHIYEGHEGQELADEGALAARAHAARHQGLDRVISHIAADYSRSQALARRLGAQRDRDSEARIATWDPTPVTVWRHAPQPGGQS
ncbi:MAG: GNAT family N-acetyltransferase [Rhodobacteraceae bacterium]|nr:GNAT family N-acetyltransferase [Paracoccaceae bacterium]